MVINVIDYNLAVSLVEKLILTKSNRWVYIGWQKFNPGLLFMHCSNSKSHCFIRIVRSAVYHESKSNCNTAPCIISLTRPILNYQSGDQMWDSYFVVFRLRINIKREKLYWVIDWQNLGKIFSSKNELG